MYGIRNSTYTNVWDIQINAELSAGAVPMDISKLVIRYSDGSTTLNYAQNAAALANGAPSNTAYNATWIRGNGGSTFVMQSGDLVQFHFNVQNAHDIAPRVPVQLTMIPEAGSPVQADFKTPATYGTDTAITLR